MEMYGHARQLCSMDKLHFAVLAKQCCAQVPFVPKRWRPKDAAVPQIPHTFPPRVLPSRKAIKAADDEPAKRKRKLTPSAWTQGAALASCRPACSQLQAGRSCLPQVQFARRTSSVECSFLAGSRARHAS